MRAMSTGVLPLLMMLACGSGSSSPGDGGGAGSGGSGGAGINVLTWLEDGDRHTATFATASLVTNASLDYLQVVGADSSGAGVSFGVATPPPLVPGTYSCGTTNGNVIVSLAANGSDNATVCTITLVNIGAVSGAPVVGSFQADVMATGGGVKALRAGSFGVPLTVSALAP
jgi:hypothetical protein